MKLSIANFLTQIKNLVTGGGREKDGITPRNDAGYKHDVNLSLAAISSDPSSAALTDSTGGTPATTLAAIVAPAANATTSLSADMLAVKNGLASVATSINTINTYLAKNAAISTNLRALSSAASTTTVGYTTFVVPRDYDEATDSFALKVFADMAGATDTPKLTVTMYRLKADGSSETLLAVADTVALSNVPQTREFVFDNKGLKRDNVVTLKITSEAHTTDAIQVFGIEPVYRSTLVSYNETDDSAGRATHGNPLR